MKLRVPDIRGLPEITTFLTEWARDIEGLDKDTLKKNTANYSVLLYSPSKKVYEIKVDDAGVVSATLVQG